jgi:hypothetical protein
VTVEYTIIVELDDGGQRAFAGETIMARRWPGINGTTVTVDS